MSDDLATWLLEQIAEDERIARAAIDGAAGWHRAEFPAERAIVDDNDEIIVYDEGRPSDDQADHIATWDPARVLAECDAKRRIVEEHRPIGFTDAIVYLSGEVVCHGYLDAHPCKTLRLLALPYADRPGFREEWRADMPGAHESD